MSLGNGKAPLLGPATVAVHDHRDGAGALGRRHQGLFRCCCPASGERKASDARTQGALVSTDTGAPEDAATRCLAAAGGGVGSAGRGTYTSRISASLCLSASSIVLMCSSVSFWTRSSPRCSSSAVTSHFVTSSFIWCNTSRRSFL